MSNKANDYQIETITCPSCQSEKAQLITHLLDIPYYDDFLMVNTNCRECGYRSSDFINLKVKDYVKYTYKVLSEEDEETKIIRSSEAVVSVPELGIKIEPVSGGLSWIRNIEGVLQDLKERLQITLKQAENDEEKRRIKQRINRLKLMLRYEIPFTITIEDPSGNSLILPVNEPQLTREIMVKQKE